MIVKDSNPRYQGKPLLRLLECYVLSAIGQLPESEANTLVQMTPKLRSIYNANGDWQQVVASASQLPENMPMQIKVLWEKNSEIARNSGTTIMPQQFAEMFVDHNLI